MIPYNVYGRPWKINNNMGGLWIKCLWGLQGHQIPHLHFDHENLCAHLGSVKSRQLWLDTAGTSQYVQPAVCKKNMQVAVHKQSEQKCTCPPHSNKKLSKWFLGIYLFSSITTVSIWGFYLRVRYITTFDHSVKWFLAPYPNVINSCY